MKNWMVYFLIMVICTGCKAEMTEEAQQKMHFVKAELEVGDRTPEERALIIKTRLKQIDAVIGTAVVVEGHTAIIGLRLEDGMEQNVIDSVKREAEALVKAADVSVENTSITVNSYIVSLIEDMERKRAG